MGVKFLYYYIIFITYNQTKCVKFGSPACFSVDPLISLLVGSLVSPLVALVGPLVALVSPLVALVGPLVGPLVALVGPLVALVGPLAALVALVGPLVALIDPLVGTVCLHGPLFLRYKMMKIINAQPSINASTNRTPITAFFFIPGGSVYIYTQL